VDGKLYTSCRPVKWQRSIWNGKDRRHGVRYQAVVNAFGLFMSFKGPHPGRRHDAEMYRQTGFEELFATCVANQPLFIYGDDAYQASQYLLKPIDSLEPHDVYWNKCWASRRVSVEWSFGKMMGLWKLLALKEKMRLLRSPVAKLVRVAGLLTNLHTIFYGGIVPAYFHCPEMPTAEQYLQRPPQANAV